MNELLDIQYPSDLPIVDHREQIIAAIKEKQVVVIAGETGSGKTTQLPKMCLEAGRGVKRLIGCTQPRRIAAVSIAARVSEEMGEVGPALVGYKVRFQELKRKTNRIRFMTDGVLLAEAERDRNLFRYDTIIVDEAHERSLNIDFLLGMLKKLLGRRKDLKLIITSATIDTEKFAKHFGSAPVIRIAGRGYPVEVRYRAEQENEGEQEIGYVERAVASVFDLRHQDNPGDILVFMPTEQDVRDTIELLEAGLKEDDPGFKNHAWPTETCVFPLFGRLSGAEQSRIFRAAQGIKIVVATNVAETSVTVPGIRYVVDTGLARIPFYSVRARTTKMPVSPISRASADQRLGRCGRIGPGVCVRLYSEEDYLRRPEYTLPEILRSNLAEVILRMMSIGLGNPKNFPFVDQPSPRAVSDGYKLLCELGAIDSQHRLMDRGRIMAKLPLDPRMARMIIEAREENALAEVLVIVAALSIQDPLVRPADREKEADAAHARFVAESSDFLTLINVWKAFQTVLGKTRSWGKVRKFSKANFLSYQRLREWHEVHEQLCSIIEEENGFVQNTEPAGYDAVHRAILSGNLRNIALKKEKNIYQAAQGKEVMIFPGSGQFNKGAQWLMAADLVETSKLYARTVATIRQEWLEPLAGDLCRSSYSQPHWEKKQGMVIALEKVTLFGLMIVAGRKVNYGKINPPESREIFIEEALVNGELDGIFGFLASNKELIRRLEGMEDRLRQRDIMVDDRVIFSFYDERLPADVWDRASLKRFIAKKSTDILLRMTEADLLNREPARELLNAFPESLVVGESILSLNYRFAPGADDDGVSVSIPVELAAHLDPDAFDWLVPGLLSDKIVFLLKGLPKGVRKQLIPIPDTAQYLYKELTPGRGGLLQALEKLIERRYGIRIERGQWPVQEIPEHLRMRFCLVDATGRIIKTSRRFDELSAVPESVCESRELALLRAQWERQGIKSWDFPGLLDKISIFAGPDRMLCGYIFPALTVDDSGFGAIRLVIDEMEARKLTRAGLLNLYLLNVNKVKSLRLDFSVPKSHWSLYEGLGSHEQFNEDLSTFILEEIFQVRSGLIPDQNAFVKTLEEVSREGLYLKAGKIFAIVKDLLQERRATLDLIARYEVMPGRTLTDRQFEDFREQVRAVVPPSFLKELDLVAIRDGIRYLKGLRIRIERAHSSPAKDAAKAQLVRPYLERFCGCCKSMLQSSGPAVFERRRLYNEFRQMIEEYKLSLFAQEIKTAFPISAKRLDEKWRELEKAFIP